jgi:hypothetical protein
MKLLPNALLIVAGTIAAFAIALLLAISWISVGPSVRS